MKKTKKFRENIKNILAMEIPVYFMGLSESITNILQGNYSHIVNVLGVRIPFKWAVMYLQIE